MVGSMMLSWIPLIGPIIQGFTSVFSTVFSYKTAQLQAGVAVTTVETNASVAIIQATDNIGIRILRDALILPPVVWAGLTGWDSIVAKHYPHAMWHTVAYPPSLAYLPYAVMVFLLGNIGLNMWNRK